MHRCNDLHAVYNLHYVLLYLCQKSDYLKATKTFIRSMHLSFMKLYKTVHCEQTIRRRFHFLLSLKGSYNTQNVCRWREIVFCYRGAIVGWWGSLIRCNAAIWHKILFIIALRSNVTLVLDRSWSAFVTTHECNYIFVFMYVYV